MKKLLFLPLMCLLLLVGCDPEEPPQRWDYLNMIIKIRVVNAYGENMLDDTVIGNLRNNAVAISYNGEKFAMKFGDTRAVTEPKLPEWYGLRLYGWYKDAELSFGEFSIDTKEYRGESFTIDWGDDTTSTVAFDLYATPAGKNEQPVQHTAIRVEDGVGKGAKNDYALVLTIEK